MWPAPAAAPLSEIARLALGLWRLPLSQPCNALTTFVQKGLLLYTRSTFALSCCSRSPCLSRNRSDLRIMLPAHPCSPWDLGLTPCSFARCLMRAISVRGLLLDARIHSSARRPPPAPPAPLRRPHSSGHHAARVAPSFSRRTVCRSVSHTHTRERRLSKKMWVLQSITPRHRPTDRPTTHLSPVQ